MKAWLHLTLKTVLPRGTRNQRLNQLNRYRGDSLGLAKQSVYAVAAEYRYHTIQSFNKYLVAGEMGVVIFCYAAFTGPTALFAIIASILIALAFRNAYTHYDLGRLQKEPLPRSQYCVDSAGDSVTLMVVLLATQTLALKYSPSLALPWPELVRGTTICVPVLSFMRMVLRPMPEPEPEREFSRRSAIYIYIRSSLFNVLWMLSFYGLIVQDVTEDPASKMDWLRGAVPLLTFGLLIIFGRNGLIRRDTVMTLFTCPRKQLLMRLKETLLQPVKPGQAGFWICVSFEFMLFAELAVSMATGVWPWLSGQQHGGGFVQVAAHLIAFGTSVVSWRYLKQSNYAAADAIQKAIDALPVHA
jgi:hypothetical protein